MITAFIFDFFDVIHRDLQKAWLEDNGFKREGGFAEASDLLDRGTITFEEYLTRYAALSNRTTETVVAEFDAFKDVDKDLVELIEHLHATYKTGLISNAHSSELRPLLDEHELHRLFNEICISSEVGIAKPDPKIFEHMAELLQVPLAECFFTDDNPDNVAAAIAAGMQGVVFTKTDAFKEHLTELGVSV